MKRTAAFRALAAALREFGANFKDNEPSRVAYAQYFVSAAARYGIPCFLWDA